MEKDNKNNSAFPVFDSDGYCFEGFAGLTKREYFAGKALQGILSANLGTFYNVTAKECVGYADALIEALNNG